jgi:hypothetical protein
MKKRCAPGAASVVLGTGTGASSHRVHVIEVLNHFLWWSNQTDFRFDEEMLCGKSRVRHPRHRRIHPPGSRDRGRVRSMGSTCNAVHQEPRLSSASIVVQPLHLSSSRGCGGRWAADMYTWFHQPWGPRRRCSMPWVLRFQGRGAARILGEKNIIGHGIELKIVKQILHFMGWPTC